MKLIDNIEHSTFNLLKTSLCFFRSNTYSKG